MEKLLQIEKDLDEAVLMVEDLLTYGSTRTTPEPCKHLNSKVRGEDLIGHAFCEDCNSDVMIATVFNNWISEFKKLRSEITGDMR